MKLRIAAVEPYFGGSHRHFLLDLQRHSRHDIRLLTLPPRLWKWRVRGASLHLARALSEAAAGGGEAPGAAARAANADAATSGTRRFDLLLCSDFVNLPDLRALLRPDLRAVPVLYYMHENQLTYPLSPDEEFDPYFGFTNVLSCLSAEAVAFNSEYHRRVFLEQLPGFLPRLPDYEPRWVADTIAAKAEVLPIGIDLAELESLRPQAGDGTAAGPEGAPASLEGTPHRPEGTPRHVLWNHRWEFDKRPERFFAALDRLAAENVPFVVDVVGESFARQPAVFAAARARLGARCGRFGYVESRQEYLRLLWQSNIVVSTADQEFFGISMAEATLCGAHPIAPRALVYEELYAGSCDRRHLYRDDDELVALLRQALAAAPPAHDCVIPTRLRALGWAQLAPRFDARFESLVRSR